METKHVILVFLDVFGFAACVIGYNVWEVLTRIVLNIDLVVSLSLVLLDVISLISAELGCLRLV